MKESTYYIIKIKRVVFLILVSALFIADKASAQTAADSTVIIRCISVVSNDSISLTWTMPNNTNGFNAYMIYCDSTNSGNFFLQDSIFNSVTTSCTIPAHAYNIFNSYLYYIRVRFYGVDTVYSIPSDTLQPIIVHVNDIGTGGVGIGQINWNQIHTPTLSSSTGWYVIYKEVGYPTGTWVKLDSTKTLSSVDSFDTFCDTVIGYKVEIMDTSCNCISVSSNGSDQFADFTPPITVQLDSVSIDPVTGEIILGWQENSSLDTKGYIIVQRIHNAYWSQVGTKLGINNTFYTSSFSSSPVDSFYILAFDTCNNTSSQGGIQNTIHLDMNIDTCGQSVVLTWNPYIGWDQGVMEYYILLSIGNGPWITIDSVADSVFTYTYNQLTQFSTFNFRIRALDSNEIYTSSSNVGLIDIILHNPPHFEYIKTATVLNDSQIELDIWTDVSAQVSRYNIQRANDSTGPFVTVGYTGKYSNPEFTFIDSMNVTTISTLYYYRFQVLDSCMIVVDSSNIVHPILTKATANYNLTNTVSWTAYSGFAGGDGAYTLYRIIDGVFNPDPIAILPYGKNTYVDTISKYMKSQGEFCYIITQNEGMIDSFGFLDSTQSNSGCTAQAPGIFIPNSFSPHGKNPIFIPVWTFTDIHLYDLVIYSRMGQLIFESTDPFTGWDGTYQGYVVPMDVYVYTITLTGQNDTQITQTGTVTVLR